MTLVQILLHQVAQQRGFAGPSLTQDVDMLKPIRETNAKGFVAASADRRTDHGHTVRVPDHASSVGHDPQPHYTASRCDLAVAVFASQGGFARQRSLII